MRSVIQWGLIVLISTLVLESASLAAEGADLTGKWRGNWKSRHNGHHGPLQARFRPVTCDKYEVVFRGRFAKVIPFRYKTTLQVTGRSSQGVHLAGSHRLGPLMGTFHYQAHATSCHFVANYQARRDHGQFLLSR